MGPRHAASHLVDLRQSILDHHAMYRVLYPAFIKPKWHQLLHAPENIQSLGMPLSWFTQERKHRCVKAVGLWAFRNYETTVLSDVVRHGIERICDGSLFCEGRSSGLSDISTLARPALLRSHVVRLAKAILSLVGTGAFWTSIDSGSMATTSLSMGAQLVATDDPVLWSHAPAPRIVFLQSLEVIDIVAWAYKGERLRVVLPPAGLGLEHREARIRPREIYDACFCMVLLCVGCATQNRA